MTVDLCAVIGHDDPRADGRCRDCGTPLDPRPGPDRVGNRPLPDALPSLPSTDQLRAGWNPPRTPPRPSLPARVLRRWVP